MRFSRAYQYTAEFEARQKGFDFAVVARAVPEIAVATRKKLEAVAKAFVKALRPVRFAPRKQHQLVLELDAIAQMPLFQP